MASNVSGYEVDMAQCREITEAIKDAARKLGFTLVGVTSTAPLEGEMRLREWLDRGYEAGMAYMRRNAEIRADPSRLLRGARSVVVVAAAYQPPGSLGEGLAPHLARYALGDDYHPVLGERLRKLEGSIRAAAGDGVRTRRAVDTAPLLERELAARAGLGWIGKNTCLVSASRGSYLFLGEVVTTADLLADEPAIEHCGTCRECIDACPGGAIVAPNVLDARRCISYLTVEQRGWIPREMRGKIGQRLFGCDACQEACPWNRDAPPADLEEFHPRYRLRGAEVEALLHGGAELDQLISGSSLERVGPIGLARNAAVVLGNRGDKGSVPSLKQALRGKDPVVRGHAAWALGRIAGPEAQAALLLALTDERNSQVRGEIADALSPG